jgi:hypothetical protein
MSEGKSGRIAINVFGRKAYITGIRAGSRFYGDKLKFAVNVEFDEPIYGLKAFAVWIPPKNYSKAEFIKVVTKEVIKRLKEERKERAELDKKEKIEKEIEGLAQAVWKKFEELSGNE